MDEEAGKYFSSCFKHRARKRGTFLDILCLLGMVMSGMGGGGCRLLEKARGECTLLYHTYEIPDGANLKDAAAFAHDRTLDREVGLLGYSDCQSVTYSEAYATPKSESDNIDGGEGSREGSKKTGL